MDAGLAMKLTIIHPCIGRRVGQRYIRTWQMEPLAAAVLAGLTPRDVEVKFYDDRIELQVKHNRWGSTTAKHIVKFYPEAGLQKTETVLLTEDTGELDDVDF